MDQNIAVRIDFRLVDESADWLVVDKPAPLIVHPTSEKKEPTLLGEVNAMLAERGEETGTLSLLNRLDRETSGLVLFSRSPQAARHFGKAMERREIRKEYAAIVSGWPESRANVIPPIAVTTSISVVPISPLVATAVSSPKATALARQAKYMNSVEPMTLGCSPCEKSLA